MQKDASWGLNGLGIDKFLVAYKDGMTYSDHMN